MTSHVQFWLVAPEGLEFIGMIDSITDPWGTVHVRLTQDKLAELLATLAEGGNYEPELQDQPPWREDNDTPDERVGAQAIQLALC